MLRTEEDFLGKKQLDANAYYGINTLRSLENFPITGYKLDASLIEGMAHVKKAAAYGNLKAGLLAEDKCDAIVFACDEILKGKYANQFPVDPIQGGAGTSVNMNINEVVANIALEKLGHDKGSYKIISPNNHVNMSQSTNDAFPTGAKIGLLLKLEKLDSVLENLSDTLGSKAKEFDSIIKMGRTHLQDAVPIRLGQEFSAYSQVVKRERERISNAGKELLTINIGATAVGTGLNAEEDYINEMISQLSCQTGFTLKRAENLVDGTQNTDSYLSLSSRLKGCMISLSKIANDLRLMASGPRTGLYEITLPPRQAGSSIMPGKVNPVMAEVVNQVAFQVAGNDTTITMACEAGQLELNVMEPVLMFNLFQSIEIMTNVLTVFESHCIKGITPNTQRLKEKVEGSIGIVTALAPHLGYEQASVVAKQALAENKEVREIILQLGLMSCKDIDKVLDPFNMTEIGIAAKELLNEKEVENE